MLESDFVRQTYIIDGVEYTFSEVCVLNGLKYGSVYQRMRKGMDINEAIADCRKNPKTWGVTFSDGTMARVKGEKIYGGVQTSLSLVLDRY